MKPIPALVASTAVAFTLFASPAAAVDTSLDFSLLPSAQGWTYSSPGTPESSVFSIVGGNTLYQDSSPGSGGYQLYDILTPNIPFRLSFTARFIGESVIPNNNFGAFSVWAELGDEYFGVGIGDDRIADINQNVLSTSIDTSVSHDYRLDVTPGVGYSLFVDGVFLASGLPRTDATGGNYLALGDGTEGGSAQGEYTALRLQQPIPEPQSALLLLLGFGVLLARFKLTKRA